MDLKSGEVQKMVDTIVETVQPLRVLVFGSVARGTDGEHSDLDLLVIMPTGTHRRKTGQKIDLALFHCGVPNDVLVATEQDVIEHGDNDYLYLKHALREGKEVYRAA